MEELIYDRKQSDIGQNQKGYHNATDLNRVEEWCEYLADKLIQAGYPVNIDVKTDWAMTTPRTVSQIERIRQNIDTIKTAYYTATSTPTLPSSLSPIDIAKANSIEKILYDIDKLIKSMQAVYVHCGVAGLGQNRIWQQRFRRAKVWSSLVETFNKYSTYTVANIYTAENEYNGAKTNLGLCLLDSQYGVGESISGINESFEILDGLVGDVNG